VQVGLGTRKSAACAVAAETSAEKCANNIYLAEVCKFWTYRANSRSTLGPAAAAESVDAAAAAQKEALLQRAEEICMEALLEDWHN